MIAWSIDCGRQFFKTTQVFPSSCYRHQHRDYKIYSFPEADKGISNPGGRILRSGVCFEAPWHIHFFFVVTVVNKIYIVNIAFD